MQQLTHLLISEEAVESTESESANTKLLTTRCISTKFKFLIRK